MSSVRHKKAPGWRPWGFGQLRTKRKRCVPAWQRVDTATLKLARQPLIDHVPDAGNMVHLCTLAICRPLTQRDVRSRIHSHHSTETDMNIKQEIKHLQSLLNGLSNDARYWDLRRTYGDYSREVLTHLRRCEKFQRIF